jgi:hypothetical protein
VPIMRDRKMERWSTYEPFFVELNDHKVADIIITDHAMLRWTERINVNNNIENLCTYLWEKLKMGYVAPYNRNEKDVFLIDDDLVMVAEFTKMDEVDLVGNPLYKMIIVTFLGRMSESFELRDLKSYYSWLRHSRRMTLIKNGRKHR